VPCLWAALLTRRCGEERARGRRRARPRVCAGEEGGLGGDPDGVDSVVLRGEVDRGVVVDGLDLRLGWRRRAAEVGGRGVERLGATVMAMNCPCAREEFWVC
jgi:hypothetical protein